MGKFFEPPPAPPLPDFRRTFKDNEVVKSYICLFTCCSTRGIHLETCESLNVSSFRLSFRRFCSRRGLPVLLLSDNASTFKSASQEIRKIARSKEIRIMLQIKELHRLSSPPEPPGWEVAGKAW